jgi:isoleucyl-tRNA synthetase
VFQQRAPQVAAAIGAVSADDAAALADALAVEGSATLLMDDEEVAVTAEMVTVVETPRTGWAVASDGGTSFALDTALTRDLEVEGAARELVRAVNDQRKAAGLALDDRIELVVSVTPDELDADLEAGGHYTTIGREVLATEVRRAPVSDGTRVELGQLGTALLAIRS